MKILFIINSLGTGGAERSTALLWEYLRKHHIDYRIIALEHRKVGIEEKILNENHPVTFLTEGFWQQEKGILQVISEYEPDIVHSILFKSNMRARLAKVLKGDFKHVESLVNTNYDPIRLRDSKMNKTGFKVYKLLNKLSQPFSVDHFVAITDTVKNHFNEHLQIHPDKVDIVYRGREANTHLAERNELRHQLSEELQLDNEKIWIIHSGRQEYQKGHIILLEALTLMSPELLDRTYFLMCGRRGNASEALDNWMRSNEKLSRNVLFLGHRHDMPQLLVASDIFVFPSLYEGLGGSLIEAQAAALPIVCSDIPVLREVVSNGNGSFFKQNDPKDLAEKLEEMIGSHDLREKYGQRSLQNFKKKFLLEDKNEEMVELYRSVI